MDMVRVFSTTPRIIMGPGSVKTIGAEVKTLGISRVLIVTDKGVIAAGLMKPIEESLKASKVKYAVFDKVEPDPRYEIVADCVETARQSKAQMLIGLGGGSPMDITKVSAVMLTNKGPIGSYFGIGLIPKPGLPTILIPTTAGTGSEVTPIAILSDEGEKLKKGIVSPYLYPAMGVLDPELTTGLPPHVTAATGMDALIHAIEAYTSINASTITDMYCIKAIELISKNLRTAFAKGDNIEARTAMMEAALLAGIGFANAGVTAVHAFAYPIGAEFHIPHGVANTLMLPHVIRFNVLGNLEKFAQLAKPFGLPVEGLDNLAIVDRVIATIDRLADDIRVPRHLADFGVKEKDIPMLAEGVMKVTRLLANNPRTLTLDDAKRIYKAAL
ncbi:MAG TPA: iron-containing alcohol dehydrogenase [Deltaproteobacteria bacterium]|jgi:alcohol dehydrogenase class IV|nr:iron-containing alcohol dehydrogenase [Deltaproteobacteria bacterium]HRW80070.1 iron-containing alcohol dehydrogenase [Desulfomonilia bacterium]HNQ86374.1 iron-containing alcohol dehydrogenase [Deltaproteobacteria bacterium]HNS89706.1 iron-containing alcohol dehydrogenase [Deltaproteobacteria bacterium]HOA44670.1 iron-containing alcohol dehydrogenase [Deltaproteobacteria bacterium]